MTTLENIIDEVQVTIGDTSGAFIDAKSIRVWVNACLREISHETGFTKNNGTISSVAGQESYSPPVGALFVDLIEYDNIPLNYIPWGEFVEYKKLTANSEDDEEGFPAYWSFLGRTLYLYPAPSSTSADIINIHYSELATLLDDESESPGTDSAYTGVIINYCLWKAYMKQDNYGAADRYKGFYDISLGKLLSDLNNPDQNSYASVRDFD